jgi:hypothetical protein
MLNRLTNTLRRDPGRLALGLSFLLALANLGLLGAALVTRRSAASLAIEVTALQDSLRQLRQVEQEGLQGLELQALEAESHLAELEASFPTLGEPFDLYRRGFALAADSGVELRAIETGGTTVLETPVGLLSTTTYQVTASAEFPACLDWLGRLERAGLQTLAVETLNLGPGDRTCDFQVIVASAAPAGQLPPPAGEG